MKNQKLEITKMLTLSTSHIKKETSAMLNASHDAQYGLSVYEKFLYGWFIYINEVDAKLLPSDLAVCVNLARANDCTIICFDVEGPLVPALQIYNWD